MSNITEWCDNKVNRVKEELSELYNIDNINDLNIYPIVADILSNDEDLEKLEENGITRVFDDYKDINYCFKKFREIMRDMNKYVVCVPSQQLFCFFMNWNDRFYKSMLHSDLSDIEDTMAMVEEYLIESQFSAAQKGITKAQITQFRMSLAGEHGSNLVSQKEQNEDDRNKRKVKSHDELLKELKAMGQLIETKPMVKEIENNSKSKTSKNKKG